MGNKDTRSTYLTPRQIEIMRLRNDGMSTDRLADAIGTTRQNVIILEKRARRNIDRAIRTVNAVKELSVGVVLEIPSQTHILDAVKELVEKADLSGIKLRDNMVGIMSRFKIAFDKDIEGGIIQKPITVNMFQDGTIQFF